MGRVRTHTRRTAKSNPRGLLKVTGAHYGFVTTAEGEFFIPEHKMYGAFDGDLVEIAPLPFRSSGKKGGAPSSAGLIAAGEKPTARVLRVIERAHESIVGRYEVAEPFGVVVPSDRRIPYDIFTMRSDNPHIPDGALVRVRIATYPSRREAATGVVEEVLGAAEDAHTSIEALIAKYKLETRFSDAALAEAASCEVDVITALAGGYRDLRARRVFTIDPHDARDFDDALSFDSVVLPNDGMLDAAASSCAQLSLDNESLRTEVRHAFAIKSHSNTRDTLADIGPSTQIPRGFKAYFRVGVHIADVSHYVPWGSSLDLDARRRATSVYLVDRVIPMLPEALSNGLCSLKPNVPRRCMTVDLYLDGQARVIDYDIYPALMQSKARFTYDEVQHILDQASSGHIRGQGAAPVGGLGEFAPDLVLLSALAQARVLLRQDAGGLDFEVPEAKVELDAQGNATNIRLREKTLATSLVEEFMILANETVAIHLLHHEFPCMYRVHEKPSSESLASLLPVLQEFSWCNKINAEQFVAGNAKELQQVLALAKGRSEEQLVSSLLLRAQKRAHYNPNCGGHYGLALAAYCHFTNPIRRYPDLVVHRMLKALLFSKPNNFVQQTDALAWLAEHSSAMERVADKAAHESQVIKMVEYMANYVGQRFSAVVSGVANYGLYVQLDNTAEGLVDVRTLGSEYFVFDDVRRCLTGDMSGVVYRLGQRVAVELVTADVQQALLSFKIIREP